MLEPEQGLAPMMAHLASLSGQARERAVAAMLSAHPLCRVRHTDIGAAALPAGLSAVCSELKLDVRAFNRWLRSPGGAELKSQMGSMAGNDDGIYTASKLLREHMPRGLSVFELTDKATGAQEWVVVRGFRKFTGLTAGDEDEESGATSAAEAFMYSGKNKADARTLVVTNKSNGENGKWAVRKTSGGHLLHFAGSKHVTHVWTEGGTAAEELYPQGAEYVPSNTIAAQLHNIVDGMAPAVRDRFLETVATKRWTLMLEMNATVSEHIIPIEADFVDFVAIIDENGLPITQQTAFRFFDEFGLHRVECVTHPVEMLADVLASTRARTDTEGVVIYLEDEAAQCIGLLKVKTDHYVVARRTREIWKTCLLHPLLAGKLTDGGPDKLQAAGGKKGRGGSRRSRGDRLQGLAAAVALAEQRLEAGMRALTHVEGCAKRWESEWLPLGLGFVHHWLRRYRALRDDDKPAFLLHSRCKFGTLFAESLPGAGCRAATEGEGVGVVEPIQHGY